MSRFTEGIAELGRIFAPPFHGKIFVPRPPYEIFVLASSIDAPQGQFNRIARNPSGFKSLAEGTLRLINLCLSRDINTVFFLDRSARPACLLFRETWSYLLSDCQLPQVKFINVGSHNNRRLVSDKVVDQLRNRYKINEQANILVADEYIESGTTLKYASELIGRMYPKAHITATGIYKDLPYWFGKMRIWMGIGEQNYPEIDTEINLYFSHRIVCPHDEIVGFRNELCQFAELIARHTEGCDIGSFEVKPLAPNTNNKANSTVRLQLLV